MDAIFDAYISKHRVFILGNGGNASTASHFVCDLSKGTSIKGKTRLAVVGLTDNIALITAISNDLGYVSVFKEQLMNLLQRDDVVIGISASGCSPNVLVAIEFARSQGAYTIGICGFGGGKLCKLVDAAIVTSVNNYGQVEDTQMVLAHLISLEVGRKVKGI